MSPIHPRTRASLPVSPGEEGSALVMTLLVLFLLTAAGVALLFVADSDARMGRAGVRSKQAFFLAEAGLEDGRETLRTANLASTHRESLDDELVSAAGANGVIDFDVANLKATYDAAGNVTGFTGYGDDQPIRGNTTFGSGRYAAFLTNDPVDGRTNLDDANDRVVVTAIGAGTDQSLEIDEAIVQRLTLPDPPAAITLLGPLAAGGFEGGSSNAKKYIGDDCSTVTGYTGDPSVHVPTVGTTSAAAEVNAETGVTKPNSYTSGTEIGTGSVHDVSATMDPLWLDCHALHDLADVVRAAADYRCTPSLPCSHWSSMTIDMVTFVDGDLDLSPMTGRGVLWVTGNLTLRGNTSWEGTVLVIGTGGMTRSGGGNGHTWGAVLVADIAGPDGVYGNADDCTGGTNGFGETVYFQTSGGGTHDTIYCSGAINACQFGMPLRVAEFRQH